MEDSFMTYYDLYLKMRQKLAAKLQAILPNENVESMINWYLKTTQYIESRGDNSAISPTGARGAFQILPSTERLLRSRFSLPPLIVGEAPGGKLSGAIYCLAHTIGDIDTLRSKDTPPMVDELFMNWPAKARVLASLRFYYHNGTSHKVPPKRVSEITNALLKFKHLMT